MIPMQFHQIWINQAQPELPEPYRTYRETWRRLNPDWSLRLWTDTGIDFALRRPELLQRCGSYAQMADVLRLEIVYKYGGVYIDTDFECFRPIDRLFAGAEAVFCSEDGRSIANSLFAAVPGSPLIARLIDGLPADIGGPYPNLETGPAFFTRQLLEEGFDGNVRLLPRRTLFPYAAGERRATATSHPAAFGAHHWAHSWTAGRGTSRARKRVQQALYQLARRLA
jgi:mannosyltransferase OCH1-like enzyme